MNFKQTCKCYVVCLQVIHVSGAEILKGKLPNLQQVDIIPRCGHAINLDRPGAKTKSLLDFRKKNIEGQL